MTGRNIFFQIDKLKKYQATYDILSGIVTIYASSQGDLNHLIDQFSQLTDCFLIITKKNLMLSVTFNEYKYFISKTTEHHNIFFEEKNFPESYQSVLMSAVAKNL